MEIIFSDIIIFAKVSSVKVMSVIIMFDNVASSLDIEARSSKKIAPPWYRSLFY